MRVVSVSYPLTPIYHVPKTMQTIPQSALATILPTYHPIYHPLLPILGTLHAEIHIYCEYSISSAFICIWATHTTYLSYALLPYSYRSLCPYTGSSRTSVPSHSPSHTISICYESTNVYFCHITHIYCSYFCLLPT